MKDKKLTFKVEYEDGWYSASCLEAFIVTQGRTFKSLENNIREAVECHFSEELETKKFKPIISINYALPVYAQIKMLRHFGFVVVNTHGSHVRMKLGNHGATIPLHSELRRKTLLDIYRQLEPMLSRTDLDEMFYTK